MPPRGVKSAKRERQYEHIKQSEKERGVGEDRAEEIAARTVNKERREAGETKNKPSSGRSSAARKSSGSRKSSSRTRSGGTSGGRKTARTSARKSAKKR